MFYNYDDETLKITQQLVQAIMVGNIEQGRVAIERGANVNCRVISTDEGYRIAKPEELAKTLSGEMRPYTADMEGYVENVVYEVPMVGTTTLLNLLATRQVAIDAATNRAFAVLLMDNKAALGGIDYASYWRNWGDHPANYFQNTPLLNAIACQNLSFATLYMEYLQKLDEVPRQEILNYKDKFIAGFHTALEFAIRRGYSRLATSIIRAGADTNPQPFVFAYAGKSPLHMACMLCGYSKFTKGWHPDLGSDLELITTLLEHGADYQLRVKTSVYEGVDTHGLMQWKSISLTALDHLGGAFMSVYGLSLRDDFDYIHACNSPAYRPVKVGQIKHPFEEEACFLANFSKMGRSLDNRFKYLSSREYQNTDKWRILDVLSQCMEKNINQCLPISHDKNPLFNPAYRNKIMHCSVNVYQERPDEPFFSVRLQPIGALLDEPAAPDFLVPDDTNDPTPKAGALFSELTMQVLGGFMVVLGVVAVAAAFTVLHTVTLGGIGVVVGGIGLAVLLKGCGLFNVGYDQNHVDQYQQQVFSGAQLVHNAKI